MKIFNKYIEENFTDEIVKSTELFLKTFITQNVEKYSLLIYFYMTIYIIYTYVSVHSHKWSQDSLLLYWTKKNRSLNYRKYG